MQYTVHKTIDSLYERMIERTVPTLLEVRRSIEWMRTRPSAEVAEIRMRLRDMPTNQNTAIGVARYWLDQHAGRANPTKPEH